MTRSYGSGLDFNLLTIGRVKEKPDISISESGGS
jgi:hypothetical protein